MTLKAQMLLQVSCLLAHMVVKTKRYLCLGGNWVHTDNIVSDDSDRDMLSDSDNSRVKGSNAYSQSHRALQLSNESARGTGTTENDANNVSQSSHSSIQDMDLFGAILSRQDGAEGQGVMEATRPSKMQAKLVALNRRIWRTVTGESGHVDPESSTRDAAHKPEARLSREKRLHLAHLHELHTLSLLERARVRSSWCDDPGLQHELLSVLPESLRLSCSPLLALDRAASLLSWLHSYMHLDLTLGLFVSCSTSPAGISSCGISQLREAVGRRLVGMEHLTLLFVAMLRGLGHSTRLVASLEPMPFNKAGHCFLQECELNLSPLEDETERDRPLKRARTGSEEREAQELFRPEDALEKLLRPPPCACQRSRRPSSRQGPVGTQPVQPVQPSFNNSQSFNSSGSGARRRSIPAGHYWCWCEVFDGVRWLAIECPRQLVHQVAPTMRSHPL